MSVLNTLPAPIIQMGHVEKLVEVAQNQSYVQQQVSRDEARKTLKTEAEQVAGTDRSAHGRKVREKEEDEGRRRQHAGDGKQRSDAEEAAEKEERSNKDNPWAGHIVSITI